jgi:hypothetical protein
MLLFVSVSIIFDWILELFRQCGILLFVSVLLFLIGKKQRQTVTYHTVGTVQTSNQKSQKQRQTVKYHIVETAPTSNQKF